MPIPWSVHRHAAGTDVRNQFTTPPDARQVEDLIAAHEQSIVGGIVMATTSVSDSTWKVVPVSGGNLVADDGNWSTAYDCWGPPDDWFDEFTYLCLNMPWIVTWPSWTAGNSSAYTYVQFRVRNQANPSGSSVLDDFYADESLSGISGSGLGRTMSGTGLVRMTQDDWIEMRIYQTSGTLMNSNVKVRWGINVVGGTD